MSAFGRIRSWPRVYGTTQKLQNSLQPSMIVTYALTGIAPPRHAQRKRHVVVGVQVEQRGRSLFAAPVDGDSDPFRLSRLLDEHRQPADRLGPDDDVGHAGRAPEDGLAFLLRDAAGDRHDRIVPLLDRELTQLAEPRVQLLLGALPDAAGVDHDDVGVGRIVDRLEAGLLEQPRHALRVVDVHLAAERFDQVLTRHVYLSLSPFAFAFRPCFRLSPRRPDGPLRKHLTSRGSQPLRNRRPAQHSRELVRRVFALEPANGRRWSGSARTRLSISKVRVGVRRDLRQVRDAQHLKRRAERLQLAADDVGDPPADAGVDLVEYQPGRPRSGRGGRRAGPARSARLVARRRSAS